MACHRVRLLFVLLCSVVRLDELGHSRRDFIRRSRLSKEFHELALTIQQIEEDGMIDEIIISRTLGHIGCRVVDTIRACHCLDLILTASQPSHAGIEILLIRAETLRSVATRIDGDEERNDAGVGMTRLELIESLFHLLQLGWADIWTVSEAKV